MSLIRATALKDFRSAALSTTDVSTGYNLGGMTSGQSLYAGFHLTSASLGTTARMLQMNLQAATASGFGSPSTFALFTQSTAPGGQWNTPVPLSSLSTEYKWFRASWTLSTGTSTGGTWKGQVWMGIR